MRCRSSVYVVGKGFFGEDIITFLYSQLMFTGVPLDQPDGFYWVSLLYCFSCDIRFMKEGAEF